MELSGDLPWLDILFIVLYFCALIGVGIGVIVKQRKGNVQNYFLAGRTMPWYAVGGSMFSANIGTEMVIGLSGAGAAAGISMTMFEWLPVFIILMFSWFLLPVYISAQVYTLPEYMEKRYGANRLRIYLSFVGIVIIIITKMASVGFLGTLFTKKPWYLISLQSVMFSGVLFIQVVVQWDMNVAIVALLVVSMIFTVLGGLKAVMFIGALQTFMVLSGGVVIMILSFIEVGGYTGLQQQYAHAIPGERNNNTTCGLPRDDAFHVFQDPVSGDQPWPGLVLQASLGGVYSWCCSQILVQRSLAARSLSHAKGGAILLATIKLFPLFLIIFPGMISRILFPDEVACADPDVCKAVCDNPAGCSNIAYPLLIMGLVPVGLRGLLLAVMLSGIMVTLSSVINSTSTVFTLDVWRKFRPAAKQRELLIVGRASVVVNCVTAILWIPLVKTFQNGRLFSYVVSVGGYMGSPLGALFCLSVLWKRATEQGAFWGIISAHLLGAVRLGLELAHPAPSCDEVEDTRVVLSRLHFTYFVQIQILFAILVTCAISMLTKGRTDEELQYVTWWTKVSTQDSDHVTNDIELTDEDSRRYPPSSREKQPSKPPMTPSIQSQTNAVDSPRTLCQRVSVFLCGTNDDVQADTHFDMAKTKYFLREDKNTSAILNVLAVMLMMTVGFMIGLFK